ncbi:MAG: NTP/NDP exchange transporter [Candidatus Binatia bacterium]
MALANLVRLKNERSLVERFLGLFAEVHPGEGRTALLLMLNLFILLTAYLVIKTVREPLILAGGGAEVKTFAAAGQALLLLLVVPLYSLLASKVNRIKLINWVTAFFISNLIAFYFLAQFDLPLGVPFFLWVGIFNLLVIAQFWSFANDLYTEEAGKRLFAILAFGGTAGAVLGPKIADWLFEPLGAYPLMLVAALLLGVCMALANWVNSLEQRGHQVKQKEAEKPLSRGDGFKLVMGSRYLLLIALLMIVVNAVNTTGEFILGKKVTEEARRVSEAIDSQPRSQVAAASVTTKDKKKLEHDFIGKFYGNFFFWVNLSTALIQLFLVSRVLKYLGVSTGLFFLPLIALGGYSLIAVWPVLRYIQIAKVLENSTDYSLQNTVRQALFLPTSRDTKYKAKAAIDTFFVRIGDVAAAALVYLGSAFALKTESFALVNLAFVLVWLALAAGIGHHYRNLSALTAEGSTHAGA